MGEKLLKIAVIYFLIAVLLGMFMSMTHNFNFTPAHAHIALLGWASLGIAGLIYILYPKAEASKLGKAHFWFHNIGLPIMMIGLLLLEGGMVTAEPIIGIGANITTIGIILFVINVFRNVSAAGRK
ncbi:cbb3-type cytochrome c oxidase subunit I [Calidifontibacillus oryziterrae]|uniref:cbb3-type cytochrome c oxidase subunit I n=1 Tax=Calidifontibacillus oryziterrae TaxID=1191699 RepID=UPI0002F6ED5D|nr:cbb3-type cytochrome c oxidase subunit I [Calidifontibacillus oryziterrae]